MNYFKTLLCIFVLNMLLVLPIALNGGAGLSGFGGLPMISEQELIEFNKAVEEIIANELTPEEQAQFYKEVDELTKELEKMSPEELEQFMNALLTEQAPPAPPTPPVEVMQRMEEELIVPTLTGAQKEKIATILAVIDTLIKDIHTYLLHVAVLPSLGAKIEKWGNNDLFLHWPNGTTWDAFKYALEECVNKLLIIKEQDPKTEVYTGLLFLIEDESLFNNLAQLQTSISASISLIEIPEHGSSALTVETKKAFRDISSKLSESLYVLELPQALDKLIARFEPEAAKLREAEEVARARALEESGRPVAPGYIVSAGKEPTGYSSYDYGSDQYNTYGGGYSNYEPYGRSYYPSYNEHDRGDEKRERGGRQMGGGKKKSKGEATPTAEKEKKGESEKGKKEEKPKAEVVINVEIEQLLAKVSVEFENIEEIIDADDRLELINEYIVETEQDNPVDIDLAIVTLNALKKKINRAQSNVNVAKRKICLLKDQELDHYKKEFDKVIKQHVILAEFSDNIKKISYQTGTDKRKISNEKRWVFFGDTDAFNDLSPKIKKILANKAPLSILDVQSLVSTLLEDIDCAKQKSVEEKKATPKEKKKKTLVKRPKKEKESVTSQPISEEQGEVANKYERE